MPGGGIQVNSSGAINVAMDGGIVVAGGADPCCCPGPLNCCRNFTAKWDCFTETWIGPTAGAKVCIHTGSMGSWVKTGQDIRYCYYSICVAPGTAVPCSVDADCTGITVSTPSLPADPTFPDDCCDFGGGHGCHLGIPDGDCCTDYTVTLSGGGCADGTFDASWNGGHWEYDNLTIPDGNDVALLCSVIGGFTVVMSDGATLWNHVRGWLLFVYDQAANSCVPGAARQIAYVFVAAYDGTGCPPTGGWVYAGTYRAGPVLGTFSLTATPTVTVSRFGC